MLLQQLPKWLLWAIFLFAANAGMINILSLMMLLHQSVSHMTGNVSELAVFLRQGDFAQALYLVSVIGFYLFGALLSGFILGKKTFGISATNGIPLTLMAILMVIAVLIIPSVPHYGLLLACVALGLQNSMLSYYKGAIVRTTHLTGVITDIGLSLGYKLRGLEVDHRKLGMHSLIVLGYLLGGLVAAFSRYIWKFDAFLLPMVLSVILGVAYWIYYLRGNAAQHS